MQKLKLIILAASIAVTSSGFGQVATATQAQSQLTGVRSVQNVTFKDVKSIALTKKCTIRRYRRPH